MAMMRTTILIDEVLAARVRQMFKGNLTRGVNVLLEKQLGEGTPNFEGFGWLRKEPALETLAQVRKERRRSEVKKLHGYLRG